MANGILEVELNSDKLNRWLTLTANVGVLVGLVVLIFEVQQNRHLVRAELGSGATTIMRELQQELANNPEISAIVAKASLGQEPLTDSELIRLDAHYEASIQFLHRERYLVRLGIFEDDPAVMAGVWARMYLNNPAAIHWWETKKPSLTPDAIELVENALASEISQAEATQLRRLRERLNAAQ